MRGDTKNIYAYPLSKPQYGSISNRGMTLRDYFAAHAPETPSWFEIDEPATWNWEKSGHYILSDEHHEARLLAWRWFYADAMLKARGQS